eukprot:CAMPEP_0170619602 /NCGR_PEP_ID=MMETSP0224-20130122/27604_1 /TAXON_ID=285029 /ORGANISM="Togula jolla, Strain CCCM 725" /LENGTH=192 /DNA_ID=CAMNT_0010945703 /DNA_START=25 /DNA_END=603 /DNA_ORIENTATION=-
MSSRKSTSLENTALSVNEVPSQLVTSTLLPMPTAVGTVLESESRLPCRGATISLPEVRPNSSSVSIESTPCQPWSTPIYRLPARPRQTLSLQKTKQAANARVTMPMLVHECGPADISMSCSQDCETLPTAVWLRLSSPIGCDVAEGTADGLLVTSETSPVAAAARMLELLVAVEVTVVAAAVSPAMFPAASG